MKSARVAITIATLGRIVTIAPTGHTRVRATIIGPIGLIDPTATIVTIDRSGYQQSEGPLHGGPFCFPVQHELQAVARVIEPGRLVKQENAG